MAPQSSPLGSEASEYIFHDASLACQHRWRQVQLRRRAREVRTQKRACDSMRQRPSGQQKAHRQRAKQSDKKPRREKKDKCWDRDKCCVDEIRSPHAYDELEHDLYQGSSPIVAVAVHEKVASSIYWERHKLVTVEKEAEHQVSKRVTRDALEPLLCCWPRSTLGSVVFSAEELTVEAIGGLAGKVKLRGECAICGDITDVLLLECQHTFCESCISGQLSHRWPGLRVTFGYLNCALCRVPVAHDALQKCLSNHQQLRRDVLKLCESKYREDGWVEDLAVEIGQIPTQDIVQERAANELTVFMCFHCGKPYCGGRVDCNGEMDLSKEQLVCNDCYWSRRRGGRRCMVHGHRYAIFKCDSCCSLATWNCTTNHYCERCHNQAFQEKHYPCPGPGKCPLGINHPPNFTGTHSSASNYQSFVIGCIKCLGIADAESLMDGEHLNFSNANMFGYPERDWSSYADGAALLKDIGDQELRDRLMQAQLPCEDAAAACAERLLLHQCGFASSELLLESTEAKRSTQRLLCLRRKLDEARCYAGEARARLWRGICRKRRLAGAPQ
jgi:hypothetical protein